MPGTTSVVSPSNSEAEVAQWQRAASLAGEINRAAVQELISYLAHEHPFVRWQAGQALAETAAKLRKRAHSGTPVWNRQAPELTFSGLLMLMRQNLQDANPLRRAAVADSLASWDHEAALQFLTQALNDPEPVVRVSVIRAIAQIRDKSVVKPLCEALLDSSLWVRRAAADALGAIASTQSVPALVHAAGDPQSLVRASIACALGHIHSTQSRQSLERLLQDEDAPVRWYAVRSLAEVGSLSSLTPLQALQEEQTVIFERKTGDLATWAAETIQHRESRLWSWLRRSVLGLWHKIQALRSAKQE